MPKYTLKDGTEVNNFDALKLWMKETYESSNDPEKNLEPYRVVFAMFKEGVKNPEFAKKALFDLQLTNNDYFTNYYKTNYNNEGIEYKMFLTLDTYLNFIKKDKIDQLVDFLMDYNGYGSAKKKYSSLVILNKVINHYSKKSPKTLEEYKAEKASFDSTRTKKNTTIKSKDKLTKINNEIKDGEISIQAVNKKSLNTNIETIHEAEDFSYINSFFTLQKQKYDDTKDAFNIFKKAISDNSSLILDEELAKNFALALYGKLKSFHEARGIGEWLLHPFKNYREKQMIDELWIRAVRLGSTETELVAAENGNYITQDTMRYKLDVFKACMAEGVYDGDIVPYNQEKIIKNFYDATYVDDLIQDPEVITEVPEDRNNIIIEEDEVDVNTSVYTEVDNDLIPRDDMKDFKSENAYAGADVPENLEVID